MDNDFQLACTFFLLRTRFETLHVCYQYKFGPWNILRLNLETFRFFQMIRRGPCLINLVKRESKVQWVGDLPALIRCHFHLFTWDTRIWSVCNSSLSMREDGDACHDCIMGDDIILLIGPVMI